MKDMALRYVLLAIIAAVAISGYATNVDYVQMELLATNKLVFMRHSVMVRNYLNYVKQRTGATNSDVADCLGRYIKRYISAEPGTKEFSGCRTATWLFAEVSDDGQMKILADIVESSDSTAAENALLYYYRRMRDKGGLEFVEGLLDRDVVSTNMYDEISTVLRLDAKDFWGKDVNHKMKMKDFCRRQLSRRKHCKMFDEVLSSIDAEYAESEQRRRLVEDAVSNRIQGLKDQHRKYFQEVKKNIDKCKGAGK